LVSTDWVAQHLTDPKVKVVEVDVDTKSYDEGHVPNYDGSWTEWGNLVGAPVEKGAAQAAAGG